MLSIQLMHDLNETGLRTLGFPRGKFRENMMRQKTQEIELLQHVAKNPTCLLIFDIEKLY